MPEPEKLIRIQAGLYRIVGLRCSCGGELRIENVGSDDFRWETFCFRCKTCDPNGWPTLAQCLVNAAEYFQGAKVDA